MTGYSVNGHIHTPHSFSAFEDMPTIFEMAVKENVRILGINDFFVTTGYGEFNSLARESGVYPLFNIEFIALDKNFQAGGIRVNDPNNPGRTYFSGKALDYPVSLQKDLQELLTGVIRESQVQVEKMVNRTNLILAEADTGFLLDFETVKKLYTQGLVRERHIAKALRITMEDHYPQRDEQLLFLKRIFGGKDPVSDPQNHAAVENEIRNNLLKAGGRAFVEEDEKAFLSVEKVIGIIKGAGGIPCYPVLLDDSKGNFTDFEGNRDLLLSWFRERNIFCIELIPGRNDHDILADFVRFFHSRGFIITFGTEHNTPEMVPLTVTARHRVPLSEDLQKISMEGCFALAAHQHFRSIGSKSDVYRWLELSAEEKTRIINLGKSVVNQHINNQ
jgi:hypothetical protein